MNQKHTIQKNILLVGLFASLVLFAVVPQVFSWTAPTATIPPKALNTSGDIQVKGGIGATDANPPVSDPKVSLFLRKSALAGVGLMTEGFLSLGSIPTFGYMSASLFDVTGNSTASRAPLRLLSASASTMTNIVLSNVGATNTKMLGIWSEKDNNWANTRVKNAYLNKLVITDPTTNANPYRGYSYTKKLSGYASGSSAVPSAPAQYDPEYSTTASTLAGIPAYVPFGSTSTTLTGAQYGPFEGQHDRYTFSNFAMFESVPTTNLDVAGKTNIGYGSTCVIRKEDECPLGTYLVKIGTYGNNRCQSFSANNPEKCIAPNEPNRELNSNLYSNGDGEDKSVGFIKAKYVGAIGYSGTLCPHSDPVSAGAQLYVFPSPALTPISTVGGLGSNDESRFRPGTVIYELGTQMMDSPLPGTYQVWHNYTEPYKTTNNLLKYSVVIGEDGAIASAVSC